MTTISKLKKKFSVNENFFRGKGKKMIFKSLLLRAIFSKQTSLKVCSLELSLENFRPFKVKKEAKNYQISANILQKFFDLRKLGVLFNNKKHLKMFFLVNWVIKVNVVLSICKF